LLTLREKSLGPSHIETVYGRHNLARVLLQKGKYLEALPVEARAVDEITAILGPSSFRTLFMTNNLGAALEGTGRLDEAEATLRKTLELRRKIHGDLNSNTQRTIAFLARLLTRRSNPEAADLFRELILLRRGRKVFDAVLDRDLDRMRDVLAETAPPSISEPMLRELIAALERAFWPGDWCTAYVRSLLGGCLFRQGRKSDAEPILRESLKVMEAAEITPAPLLDQARKRFALLGAAPTQAH
jgi:tetratricopeptide (TPR) repeat protein